MSSDHTRLQIEAMLKHLPPSGSTLRLWDVGGKVAAVFLQYRKDLNVTTVNEDHSQWPDDVETVDCVAAYGLALPLDDDFLRAALRALRPGGRMIVVSSDGEPAQPIVNQLEQCGHTRILVENVAPVGVLIRGERPHTTQSTMARIRVAANTDQDNITWERFDGPYVFLLVIQQPNKPVWALREGETLTWQAAVANLQGSYNQLIGFTSLPKAIGLMQPAVMQGVIADINKVAKFSREALTSLMPVMLNPTLDALKKAQISYVAVDPNLAELPDE